MGYIIKWLQEPKFFCLGVGADYAAPGNGWLDEKDKALRFAREEDAREFMKVYLRHQEPFTEVVPHG